MKPFKLISPVVLAAVIFIFVWMVARPASDSIATVAVLANRDQADGNHGKAENMRLVISSSEGPESRNLSEFKIMYPLEDTNVFLHAAFMDDRFEEGIIRIFGMQEKGLHLEGYQCRFYSQESTVEVAWDIHAHWSLVDDSWPHWSKWYAMMFECRIPQQLATIMPKSVIVLSPHGKNLASIPIELPIVPKTSSTHALAVCIKPLTGQFPTSRILEWIEIQRLAGVEDFIMYNTDLFGASRFVLEYYESLGKVTLVSFPYLTAILERVERLGSLSPEERYAVYQQTYLVALHDCLYRFHRSYDHLVIIDVDEIILPAKQEPLPSLIDRASKEYSTAAAFLFLTSWHFEEAGRVNATDIPDYLYMQRFAKGSLPIDNQPKSILVTNRAVTFNFHVVLQVTKEEYKFFVMPWAEFGYLHHYRGKCADKFSDEVCLGILGSTREDPVVPVYKRDLINRVNRVREHLQLI